MGRDNRIIEFFSFKGIGAIIGAISGTFYAASGVFTKLMAGSVIPGFLSFTRSLFMLLSTIPLSIYFRTKFWSYSIRDYAYLTAIGLDGALVSVLQYYAFQIIDLSDAITIISSFPIFVAILACFFLHEKCTKLDCFLVITCLSGVVLCIQPEYIFNFGDNSSHKNMMGIIIAIIAAFGWAVNIILIKKVNNVDIITIQIVEFVVCAFALIIYLGIVKEIKLSFERQDIEYIVLNGTCSILAVYLSTISLKLDSALMFSIGKTAEISGSIFMQIYVFNIYPNSLTYIGASLVTIGIITPSLFRLRERYEEYSPV